MLTMPLRARTANRTIARMAKTKRFELRMEPAQRQQLDAMAARLNVTSSEAARIALMVGITAIQGEYAPAGPEWLQTLMKLVGASMANPDQQPLFVDLANQIDLTHLKGDPGEA